MNRRPQTYLPPLPQPHTRPLVDQQNREDLAELLEKLANDLRSGTATESGLEVGPSHGRRRDPEIPLAVRIAVTTTSPAINHAQQLIDKWRKRDGQA